jgi:hypothetical protein
MFCATLALLASAIVPLIASNEETYTPVDPPPPPPPPPPRVPSLDDLVYWIPAEPDRQIVDGGWEYAAGSLEKRVANGIFAASGLCLSGDEAMARVGLVTVTEFQEVIAENEELKSLRNVAEVACEVCIDRLRVAYDRLFLDETGFDAWLFTNLDDLVLERTRMEQQLKQMQEDVHRLRRKVLSDCVGAAEDERGSKCDAVLLALYYGPGQPAREEHGAGE